MAIRLIVAGSRDFANGSDQVLLNKKLDRLIHLFKNLLRADVIILHGGAHGVDTLADLYALHHKIPVEPYFADWVLYGRSAGMQRNRIMAEKGDYLIAFWDGKSPGTKNMIELMRAAHKPYTVIRF